MNNNILKLEPPYNIIYAGGRIGKHIATLTVWDDDAMGVYGARQYPMIDEGGELPAGALACEAELQDCRVICNESNPRVGLRWLAFDGTHDLMIAQSYTISGFYFYARGTVEEVYKELHYQHGIYESCFYNDHLVIKFKTPDGWERHIIDLLNADEESYTPAENEEELF